MYAIVESGGRQYRAEAGNTFSVEKLPYEVGDQIEIKDVLLLADGDSIVVGAPVVKGATVKATVVEQYRGEKILVFRYRSKQGFRRRKGHRQDYTRLRVDEVIAG